MNQHPQSITRPDLLDGNGERILYDNGKPITTRQYEYINSERESVFLQEHSLGHVKAIPGHGTEPHFNIRPSNKITGEVLNIGSISGTHGHYNF